MKLTNFIRVGGEVEVSTIPVDEDYINKKRQSIRELNNLIVQEDKFKTFIQGKIVCFNCNHNTRLYIDKGECSVHNKLVERTDLCERFIKRCNIDYKKLK